MIDSHGNTLSKGGRVEIRGFGSFSLNHRPARLGRNPKTGEKVSVPEKFVPHFKPGKELKLKVDNVDRWLVGSARLDRYFLCFWTYQRHNTSGTKTCVVVFMCGILIIYYSKILIYFNVCCHHDMIFYYC